MSERIELNSEISRAEGIQGIRQSRENRPEEAKKKFAFELERKLQQDKEKKKDDQPDDEIIIHNDSNEKEEHKERDEKPHDHQKDESGPKIKINLLA